MAELTLTLMGGLEISQNGVPLADFKPQKGLALLCYLAITDKSHTRSALAGLLWPHIPEANARTNLRKALSRLPSSISDYLIITRQTIGLNPDRSIWVDAVQLEAGLAPNANIDTIHQAVALYKGDFLESFSLWDAPTFDEWAAAQRARLRQGVLAALQRLVTHYTNHGAHVLAIDYARQLLTIEPWQEEAHRELMWLLAVTGQRSAALIQYEQCRQLLEEGLKVVPSEATADLYEAIQRDELTVTTAVTPSASPTFLPHNLPPQATPFIGRGVELESLSQLIADPDTRLITIVGLGGIGKTRLALACGEQCLMADSPFPHGVFFINLAPLNEAEQMESALADGLDFRLQGGDGRSSRQQLLDYLHPKKMLLLFDNFEHLLDGVDLLTDILQAAPEVQILVTSRERLHLRSEQVYPIVGLTLPNGEGEDKVASTAVQLFLQTAQRNQPDFTLRDDNDSIHLAHICHTVAGMPLALELAASWVDMLPLAEIAAELQHGLNFLETEIQDMPERHRSMRAAIDRSWQKLPGKEQDIFSKLSIFRGGFTREAAQVVARADLQQLARLVSKSLVQSGREDGRYEVHELLRQYGAERLAESVREETVARERHSAFYCHWLQQRESDLKGRRQGDALTRIEVEEHNIRLAWQWAGEHRHWKELDQAVNSLGLFYRLRYRNQEGAMVCRLVTANLQIISTKSRKASVAAVQPMLAKILVWQANLAWLTGQKEERQEADILLQKVMVLLSDLLPDSPDTRPVKAHALLLLGLFVDRDEASINAARKKLEKSVALYQAAGDQWGMATALRYLGLAQYAAGLEHEARHSLDESLVTFQELGDPVETAAALIHQANIAMVEGRLEEARRWGQKALAVSQKSGNEGGVLNFVAWIALHRGELVQADAAFRKSLVLLSERNWPYMISISKSGLSLIHMHWGQYEQAANQAQQALNLAPKEYGIQMFTTHGILVRGGVALATGEYDQAHQFLEETVNLYRTRRQQHFLVEALGILGTTLLKLDRLSEAKHCLYEGLQTAVEIRSFKNAPVLAGLALLLVKLGQAERAIELYSLVENQPLVANSCWFDDVYGRPLATAMGDLPSDVIEAVKTRGSTVDLWQMAAALLQDLPYMVIG